MSVPVAGDRARVQPGPVESPSATEMERTLDLLFVNPPSPDGDTWIRCQHRAGQRAPDGTVWPQTALAQLAALFPDRHAGIADAIARRQGWADLEAELRRRPPRWYVTQVAGPTLAGDLGGVELARRLGAATVAFGPLVTPLARELLERFPALDYVLCGEPEATLRELVDTVDGRWDGRPPDIARLCEDTEEAVWPRTLGAIRGLAWRHEGQVIANPPRPLIPRLDELPLPGHHLLPLGACGAPAVQAPAAMVVTGRGCPESCCFCLKHVVYGQTVRLRSPERIVEELFALQRQGVRHVYMQADLFTVCRDQVAGLCRLMAGEGLRLAWSCSSRVDAVDEELLRLMGRAGCRRVTWAIESGDEGLLCRAGKAVRLAQVEPVLAGARAAGMSNWGSFILGLPGETEETIRQTVALAKRLSLEHVTFDLAVPRPGTPFWEEATAKHWLRPRARCEEADVCGPTILDYPWLRAGRLELWLERAYREWALRPGSLWGDLRNLAQPSGVSAGLERGAQA